MPSYLISEDEWCAKGFDEADDPPNCYDDDGDPDPEDFKDHPSLSAAERNSLMHAS